MSNLPYYHIVTVNKLISQTIDIVVNPILTWYPNNQTWLNSDASHKLKTWLSPSKVDLFFNECSTDVNLCQT